MKQTLLIIAAFLFITSAVFPQSKMNINNLVEYGDKKYAPNDDEPYTGKVFDFYENGQKKLDGRYRKGLMTGKWTYYHKNGQISEQGSFIDGDGSYPDVVPDSLKSKLAPIDGRSGRWTAWYENGQKRFEGTFKDGKEDGLHTVWYENGQKMSEVTYKDGKLEGRAAGWNENGQKWGEATFKDGELIEETRWDEDGNVTHHKKY
jgi:antitoxin component YwqK of YwqJK toxin-antitoxin module